MERSRAAPVHEKEFGARLRLRPIFLFGETPVICLRTIYVGPRLTLSRHSSIARRQIRRCARDAFASTRSDYEERAGWHAGAVGVDRAWRASAGERRLG